MSHAMANHENGAIQRVLYMMAQASTANWRIRVALHNESASATLRLAAPARAHTQYCSTMDKCMPFTYMWAYQETINTQEQL